MCSSDLTIFFINKIDQEGIDLPMVYREMKAKLSSEIIVKQKDAVIVVHGIVGSLGFTCLGLHMYYGTPWVVLYAQRLVQTPLLVALNTLLVFFLYKSPLTAMVNKSTMVKNGPVNVTDHAK